MAIFPLQEEAALPNPPAKRQRRNAIRPNSQQFQQLQDLSVRLQMSGVAIAEPPAAPPTEGGGEAVEEEKDGEGDAPQPQPQPQGQPPSSAPFMSRGVSLALLPSHILRQSHEQGERDGAAAAARSPPAVAVVEEEVPTVTGEEEATTAE